MNDPERTRLGSLPLTVELWVYDVCNRFEAAWREGHRPRVAEFLDDAPAPGRAALLRELILLDVEYRRGQGESPCAEDYRSVFPTLPPDWLARESAVCERAGRYRLQGEIGRGGMGAVYRAHDPNLDRELAVKVLHEQYRDNSAARERFLTEAQITA